MEHTSPSATATALEEDALARDAAGGVGGLVADD
jgi:hypothetical protein